jgi:hypothetical protein
MECFCCRSEGLKLARRVNLRECPASDQSFTSPDDPKSIRYTESATYRPAVVCQACYSLLDSPNGTAVIAGTNWNINGVSRGDKATVYDEAKYEAFQAKERGKLGLE